MGVQARYCPTTSIAAPCPCRSPCGGSRPLCRVCPYRGCPARGGEAATRRSHPRSAPPPAQQQAQQQAPFSTSPVGR
eukprot:scaffold62153_cov61-Phaeocystis_antarctica.AAC.4